MSPLPALPSLFDLDGEPVAFARMVDARGRTLMVPMGTVAPPRVYTVTVRRLPHAFVPVDAELATGTVH